MKKTIEEYEKECNDDLNKIKLSNQIPMRMKKRIEQQQKKIMIYAKIAYDALDRLDMNKESMINENN